MNGKVIVLAAGLAWAIGCDVYDITLTEKGIKAGVAVEGNTWLVGTKPGAVALYLRDSLETGIATAPCILACIFNNAPLFWGFLIAPLLSGVKHILGGKQWATLLAGGKLAEPQTWWEKLLQG